MNHRMRVLIPSLLMAAGVLGGGLVSVLTSESGVLTMLGPLVALAMVAGLLLPLSSSELLHGSVEDIFSYR